MFPCPESLEADQQTAGHDQACKANDLTADQIVLESFVQLLPMPSYTRALWEGLVTSMGGMSVSVVSKFV